MHIYLLFTRTSDRIASKGKLFTAGARILGAGISARLHSQSRTGWHHDNLGRFHFHGKIVNNDHLGFGRTRDLSWPGGGVSTSNANAF